MWEGYTVKGKKETGSPARRLLCYFRPEEMPTQNNMLVVVVVSDQIVAFFSGQSNRILWQNEFGVWKKERSQWRQWGGWPQPQKGWISHQLGWEEWEEVWRLVVQFRHVKVENAYQGSRWRCQIRNWIGEIGIPREKYILNIHTEE